MIDEDFLDDFEGIDGELTEGTTANQDPSGEQPLDTDSSLDFDSAPEQSDPSPEENPSNQGDFLTELLKSRGIDDITKIRFENEDGAEEEVDWNSLSNEDKLNIINSSANDPDTDLDESEILLINIIRQSRLTPQEYLQHLQKTSVDQYVKENQENDATYSTDQYSDDELFVMDFIARMGDVTDEEALEALEKAKSNETLFAKQIGAIRKEYKAQEEELIREAQAQQEQNAQAEYNQFANSIADQINDFTEYSGYELNLNNDEMQDLYDFITGYDAAGNNHFAKALADPKTLVRTAYLALNGQQMINDITEYFKNEITNVRKESYKKGLDDAQKKMNKTDVVFKNKKTRTSNHFDADLDDF